MLVVLTSFKGIIINTKMRLEHELFSSPETSILKWLGYISLCYLTCLQSALPSSIAKTVFYSGYLPIQNDENIFPNKSSLVNSPVIWSSSCWQILNSSARISPAT